MRGKGVNAGAAAMEPVCVLFTVCILYAAVVFVKACVEQGLDWLARKCGR